MMEHENERMSYSFEPSDESSGAQGYHQTSYDPNYMQNEHKNPVSYTHLDRDFLRQSHPCKMLLSQKQRSAAFCEIHTK